VANVVPPPAGWWQAADGQWYPPELRPWQASDGQWYPGEQHPSNAGLTSAQLRKLRSRSVQPPEGMGLVPGTNRFRPLVPDPGRRHFARFMVVTVVMNLLLVVGLVWLMFMLGSTGRRKRDVLLAFVPVLGNVVVTQAVWRYTARNVYWSARVDRPSRSRYARK